MVQKSDVLEEIKDTTYQMVTEKDKGTRSVLKGQLTECLENFDIDQVARQVAI